MHRQTVVLNSFSINSFLTTLLIIFTCICHANCDNNSKIAFLFPEFDYKETNKNVCIYFHVLNTIYY